MQTDTTITYVNHLSEPGEELWLTATTFNDLSDALILPVCYDEAEPVLVRTLASMHQALPTHWIKLRLEKKLATLYQQTGGTVTQARCQDLVEKRDAE